MSRSESEFQREVKEDLKTMFDGCMVLKTDPTDIQGIPDLLILYRDKWASLECKKSRNAPKRPNQEYYVNKMNMLGEKIVPEDVAASFQYSVLSLFPMIRILSGM